MREGKIIILKKILISVQKEKKNRGDYKEQCQALGIDSAPNMYTHTHTCISTYHSWTDWRWPRCSTCPSRSSGFTTFRGIFIKWHCELDPNKLYQWSIRTSCWINTTRDVPQTHVFGIARWAQSRQRRPRWSVTLKHPDRSCWLGRPLFTTHAFSRSVSLTQFPQDCGCLATDYSLRISGGKGRGELRTGKMECSVSFVWKSDAAFRIFFLFLLSSQSFFFPLDFSTLTLYIIKGQRENNHLPLFSHPIPTPPPQKKTCPIMHIHSFTYDPFPRSHTLHHSPTHSFINPDKLN